MTGRKDALLVLDHCRCGHAASPNGSGRKRRAATAWGQSAIQENGVPRSGSEVGGEELPTDLSPLKERPTKRAASARWETFWQLVEKVVWRNFRGFPIEITGTQKARKPGATFGS